MRLTAKDFGLQQENMKTSTSPNRRERQLIMITGWGTPERDRDRETDRQMDRWTEGERKREGGCSALWKK